jgi:hypothetical protein
MNNLIQSFFESKAHKAMEQSLARGEDLRLFKQVQTRIEAGEDLSKELPQLKKLTPKAALATIKGLIKDCEEEMTDYWLLPNSPKIKTTVKATNHKHLLIPNIEAYYVFVTKLGKVNIGVNANGNYIFVSANTEDVKKANTELALNEVAKQLTFARFLF